tara:strand:+ start:12 stop:845 length:834 start_codon:yes stop_codon:yes gene_type:complete
MEAFCGKEFAPGPRALAQGIAVAMSKPKTAGNGANSCRPSGLPKPALHFVEALRNSYGYAARASSRGMTGLGKQYCFHLSLKGSKRADAYPVLANHIGAPINTALIIEHWDELLRLAASIISRTVAPSAILKRFSASPKSSNLAKALREVGRIERTLLMIEWYSSPLLRHRCQAGLNKGEVAHKLKRAVFFHERGEIRDRSFDSEAFRASSLNLVISSIVHWNTVYLSRAIAHLRQRGRNIPDELLKQFSPLSWEHINLTGIYAWDSKHQMDDGFRL